MVLTNEKKFDLLVDGVPYMINVTPFSFNDEKRFLVRVNGGDEHVFTWDSELATVRAIDDTSGVLPIGLEEALSTRLQAL